MVIRIGPSPIRIGGKRRRKRATGARRALGVGRGKKVGLRRRYRNRVGIH